MVLKIDNNFSLFFFRKLTGNLLFQPGLVEVALDPGNRIKSKFSRRIQDV